jgi:hypothetical protein
MRFLNSLNDRLTTMERQMQAFPEEFNSIVRRLDRSKWGNLLVRVNEDFNKLLDKLSTPQSSGVLALPLIWRLQPLSITPVTSEDRSRWRAAHKSDIRVVIGKGRVQVMAASEITGKRETAVSQITPVARQQGYIVLSWDQYQKLLDEMGKLISDDEEWGKVNGLPLPTTTPK